MRRDNGALCHCKQLGNARMAQMRNIDDHALRFHIAHDLPSEISKPAFLDAMHRASELIVKEMRQPSHADARIVELAKICALAFEIVEAFDRHHDANRRLCFFPSRKQGADVAPRRERP